MYMTTPPENSETSDSDTVVMSEDTDQLLIDALHDEIDILKNIVKLLIARDNASQERINSMKSMMLSQLGHKCSPEVFKFL